MECPHNSENPNNAQMLSGLVLTEVNCGNCDLIHIIFVEHTEVA
jgi:hypothetical protein